MPFEDHLSRAFTVESVERNAPARSGIYGIRNAEIWLFIGEADDLRVQLLAHLYESNAFLLSQHPTRFAYESCPPVDRRSRHDQLVQELQPILNRRVPQKRR